MDNSANPVTLRCVELQDAGVIAEWSADPNFCLEADWTTDVPVTERQRFHEALIQSPPPDLIRLAAIHEDTLVGYVHLHGDEAHKRELGFVIGERRRFGEGGSGASPVLQALTLESTDSIHTRSVLRHWMPTNAPSASSGASA